MGRSRCGAAWVFRQQRGFRRVYQPVFHRRHYSDFFRSLLAIALVLLFVKTGSAPAKAVTLKEMQIGRVFRDKKFLIFCAMSFYAAGSPRKLLPSYPLLIKQLGGDTSLVGYASALMFVSRGSHYVSLQKDAEKKASRRSWS